MRKGSSADYSPLPFAAFSRPLRKAIPASRKSEGMRVMKVLIVEDHPPMRQLIHSVVADMAEAVAECTDGAEADPGDDPAEILTDSMLPDGFADAEVA